MKVVINKCHGGFGLSDKAIHHYAKLKGLTLYPEKEQFGLVIYYTVPKDKRTPPLPEPWASNSLEDRAAYNKACDSESLYDRNIKRDDPFLVQTVEELGSEIASGEYGELKVVEIPDGISWDIEEYDGLEWVAESHATWG